jgi:hypothetical protein
MSVEICVEGEGLGDVDVLTLEGGAKLRDVVVAVSSKTGIAVEELFVFDEDGDEVLALDIVIDEERAKRVHHVHRVREIEVTVNYKAEKKSKKYPPSVRIGRVLDWAVGEHGFKIDPSIAPEMELALEGTEIALPKPAHIGRYVKHPHHHLHLDLIRGIVPNG